MDREIIGAVCFFLGVIAMGIAFSIIDDTEERYQREAIKRGYGEMVAKDNFSILNEFKWVEPKKQ